MTTEFVFFKNPLQDIKFINRMRAEYLKRWLATAQKAETAEKEATTTVRSGMK